MIVLFAQSFTQNLTSCPIVRDCRDLDLAFRFKSAVNHVGDMIIFESSVIILTAKDDSDLKGLIVCFPGEFDGPSE